FYIALHHEKTDSITFPYHVDEKDGNPGQIFNFSNTSSLTGKVIESRTPLIFYEQDIIDFATQQNQNVVGTTSKIWLGAPMIIKNRVIGAVAIQNFISPAAYDQKDLDLLNVISQHIALAIERKESEKQLLTQQQLLETILESSPVGICLLENRVFKWVKPISRK
ncbi:MAG: GAF domain-containing protein, partial [Flavobacteriaceae bacterium]|nr:GAF domain-containing protein [Flavobacteriaceae bacterium]